MLGDCDEDEEPDDDEFGDDPTCPDCGCDLFTENHDWDCGYVGEDDE